MFKVGLVFLYVDDRELSTEELDCKNKLLTIKNDSVKTEVVTLLNVINCPADNTIISHSLKKIKIIIEVFKLKAESEGFDLKSVKLYEQLERYNEIFPPNDDMKIKFFLNKISNKKKLFRFLYCLFSLDETHMAFKENALILCYALFYLLFGGKPLIRKSLEWLVKSQDRSYKIKKWYEEIDPTCSLEYQLKVFKAHENRQRYSDPDIDFHQFIKITPLKILLEKLSNHKVDNHSGVKHIKSQFWSPLYSKLQLPYRPGVILTKENKDLITSLNKVSDLKKGSDLVKHTEYLLTFLLAAKVDYIDKLVISKASLCSPNVDYICLKTGCWVKSQVVMENAKNMNVNTSLLNKHEGILRLNLPKKLIGALNKCLQKTNETIISFSMLKHYLIESSFNSEVIPFKKSSVRKVLPSLMAEKSDIHMASLILSNTESVDLSELYYLSISHKEANDHYVDLLSSVEFEFDKSDINLQKDIWLGSQVSTNLFELSKAISDIAIKVQNILNSISFSNQDYIDKHNKFTAYICFMLLANSGHRYTVPYSFGQFTMDKDYILLKDKEKTLHTSIRPIPIADMVKEQIQEYYHHCKYMSNKLTKDFPDIAIHLICLAKGKASALSAFGIINTKGQWEPICYQHIIKALNFDDNLPENFFRHCFSSYLRKIGKGKYAPIFLGHMSHGEHCFVQYSPFSLSSLNKLELFNGFVKELGFDVVTVSHSSKGIREYSVASHFFYPFKVKPKVISKREIYWWLLSELEVCGLDFLNRDKHTENNDPKDVIEKEKQKKFYDSAFTQVLNAIQGKYKKEREIKLAIKLLTAIKVRVEKNKVLKHKFRKEPGLIINDELIYQTQLAEIIKSLLVKHVLHSIDKNNVQADTILLSFLCFINKKVDFSPAFLSGLMGTWYHKRGIARFYVNESGVKQRIIVDSFTLALKGKFNPRNAVRLEKVLGTIKSILNSDDRIPSSFGENLTSLECFNTFLSTSFDKDIPSYLRYYRGLLFTCKTLHEGSFSRMLFSESIEVNNRSGLAKKSSYKKKNKTSYEHFKLLTIALDGLKIITNRSLTKKDLIKAVTDSWKSIGGSINGMKFEKTDDISPIIMCIYKYAYTVAISSGRNGEDSVKAKNTIYQYITAIGAELIAVVEFEDILNYNEFDFINTYNNFLLLSTHKDPDIHKSYLNKFHRFLIETYSVPSIEWTFVNKEKEKTDGFENTGHLITQKNYESALKLIDKDKWLDKQEIRVCKLILILAFRLGMRPDDMEGMYVVDFHEKAEIFNVESNAFRRVKTGSSNRNVPFKLFLSSEEFNLFNEQVEFLNSVTTSQPLRLMLLQPFMGKDNEAYQKIFQKLSGRGIDALKLVTGDENVSLRTCRASFASYTFALLNYSKEFPFMHEQLSHWVSTNNVLCASEDLRFELTRDKEISVKIIPALSMMMGHSSPLVTMRYYVVIFELLLYSYNEQQVYHRIPTVCMDKLLNVHLNNCKQRVHQKSKKLGGWDSFSCCLSKTSQFDTESVVYIHPKALPETNISRSDYCNSLVDLHKKLKHVQFNYKRDEVLSNAIITVMRATGYCRTVPPGVIKGLEFLQSKSDIPVIKGCNINLNGKYFIEICQALNKLKNNEIDRLVYAWILLYNDKLGFRLNVAKVNSLPNTLRDIIPNGITLDNSRNRLVKFMSLLDVSLEIEKEKMDIITKRKYVIKNSVGIEKEFFRLLMKKGSKELISKHQKQIHDVLFLLSVNLYFRKKDEFKIIKFKSIAEEW